MQQIGHPVAKKDRQTKTKSIYVNRMECRSLIIKADLNNPVTLRRKKE